MSIVRELKKPDVATRPDNVPRALCAEFATAQQGLYAFAFRNDDPDHVYDKNGDGVIIIRARGASMKPGKFEQSFHTRIANCDHHLHRKRTDGTLEQSMWECFIGGFVLDLSDLSAVAPAARIFEAYWVHAVNSFLQENLLLLPKTVARQHRGEWRYLKPGAWTDVIYGRLGTYLTKVAARIDAMAAAADLPRSRP